MTPAAGSMHLELEMVRDGEGEAAGLVGGERVGEGHLDRRAIRVARRGGGGGRRRRRHGQSAALVAALPLPPERAGQRAGRLRLGLGLGRAPSEREDDAAVCLAEELEGPARRRRVVALGPVRDQVALQRHHVLHIVAPPELGEHPVLRPHDPELRGASSWLHARQQHVHVATLAWSGVGVGGWV